MCLLFFFPLFFEFSLCPTADRDDHHVSFLALSITATERESILPEPEPRELLACDTSRHTFWRFLYIGKRLKGQATQSLQHRRCPCQCSALFPSSSVKQRRRGEKKWRDRERACVRVVGWGFCIICFILNIKNDEKIATRHRHYYIINTIIIIIIVTFQSVSLSLINRIAREVGWKAESSKYSPLQERRCDRHQLPLLSS